MANQTANDQDNGADESNAGNRWSSLLANAKLGRFVSVVLFLLAGSVAVVYSMRSRPPMPAAAADETDPATTSPTDADGQSPALQSGSTAAEDSTGEVAESGSTPTTTDAEPNPYLQSSAGFLATGLASLKPGNGSAIEPPAANDFAGQSQSNSSVVKAAAPITPVPSFDAPGDSGFVAQPLPETNDAPGGRFENLRMPGGLAGNTQEPKVDSEPTATKPPEQRFAQLPGTPLFGSRNGFGTRDGQAEAKKGGIGLPASGPLNAAKPQSGQPTADLTTNELRGGAPSLPGDGAPAVASMPRDALPALATQQSPAGSGSPFSAPTTAPISKSTDGSLAQGNAGFEPQTQSPSDAPGESPAAFQPFQPPAASSQTSETLNVQSDQNGLDAPQLSQNPQVQSLALPNPALGTAPPEQSTAPFAPATAFPDPAQAQPLPKQSDSLPTASTGGPLVDSDPIGGNALNATPPPAQAFPDPSPTQIGQRNSTAGLDRTPPMSLPATGRIQSKADLPSATGGNIPAAQAASTGSYTRLPGPPAATASPTIKDVPGDRRLEGVQNPQLTIQKISPPEVQVNQPADFQIVVKNVGATAVDQVQVHDRIPDGTRYDGATPEPSDRSQGTLVWSLGTLTPGQEKRISLRLTPQRPGEIGSVAQLTFASRSSMRTRVTQPILDISHRARPRVLVGEPVVFDVVVTNKGDGPARDVLIQEQIPPELTFTNNFREIEYSIGTLLPGQSRSVRLQLTAKQAGKLKNVMLASATGGLRAQHELDLEVVAPQLKMTSDGPTRRFLGREATHSVTLSNPGTAPATNVELIARLPRGVKYLSANNRGVYDPNSHAVFWSLAQLATTQQAGVELTTTPTEVGQQPIVFETVADLDLRQKVTQELEVEHLVDVFFDIDDVVDPIEIGSRTQYRVELQNQGTKVATDVRVVVDFPAGLQPLETTGNLPFTIQGRQVIFQPIASMRPGQKINLGLTATGQAAGDHRVIVKVQTADRSTPVSKEESTQVYSDH